MSNPTWGDQSGQRGGLDPRPMNAPVAAPLGIGVQPGSLPFLSRLIISAPGGFSGIFVYTPSPGLGHLIYSEAPAAGTDPFGNPFPKGSQWFDPASSTKVTIDAPTGGIGTAIGILVPSGNGALGLGEPGDGSFRVKFYSFGQQAFSSGSAFGQDTFIERHGADGSGFLVVTRLSAIDPSTSPVAGSAVTAETWHTMALNAGFAAGSPAPRYRLMPDNTVRLAGTVSLSANQAANTAFITLPAGYRPTFLATPSMTTNLSGGSVGAVTIETSGAIQINFAGTAGNIIILDGATFPLD